MFRLHHRGHPTFILAVLALLTLTGCYASQEPVIERGQYVKLAGTFTCRDRIMGRAASVIFEEKKEGFLFPGYTYGSHGDELKFTEASDGLLLAQLKEAGKPIYALVFAKQVGADIVFMVPNMMSKSGSLDALLRANNLTVKQMGNGDRILLQGSADDKLAFLKKHTPDLLMEVASCSPS